MSPNLVGTACHLVYYYSLLNYVMSVAYVPKPCWNSLPSSLLEKWFPLRGERAHGLKLFGMYDKRFEISKTK